MGSIPEELLLARIRRETEARIAAIASLRAALQNATAAMDQKVLVAASKLSNSKVNASAIAGIILRSQVEEGFALAEQVTLLEARFTDRVNSAFASIMETRTAYANADKALAEQNLTLQAQFNANTAKFNEKITVLATSTEALATRTTTLEATVNNPTTGVAAAHARITTEETARATADSALATRSSTLEATVNNPTTGVAAAHSRITTEESARATADLALASRTTTLESTVNNSTTGVAAAHARISTEETTRATADSALSSRISTLESSVNDPTSGLTAANARITTEETARATADSALASRTTTIEATVNNPTTGLAATNARITTEETARASADSALASRATALEATVNSATDGNVALKARIATEETARANADSALSTSINTVSATANGKVKTFYQSATPTASAVGDLWVDTTGSTNAVKRWDGSNWVDTQVAAGAIGAAVATESTARATADGNLSGKYSLKVIAGNIVTGMNISSSTGGGTDVSDITFQGANFKIHNGSTGVVPFSVNTLTNTVTLSNVVVDTLAANIQITTPTILGSTLKFSGASTICSSTSNGSDNGILRLNGGGSDGPTRGGQIDVIGNEYSTVSGYAGSVLVTPGDAANGAVYIRDRSSVDRIKVDTGGNVVLNGSSATYIYNASFQTSVITNITLKGSQLVFADTGGTPRINMEESWGIKINRSSDQHHFHTSGTALVVGNVLAGTSLTGNRIYFGGSGVYLYENGGALYLHDGNGDRALT